MNINRCLLIFGMHRSGTSAMAKVCNLLGTYLGDQLAPPDTDNIKGFFEDLRITESHEKLLNNLGASWDFAGPLPDNWLDRAIIPSFRSELEKISSSLSAGHSLWGFKDPRLSRLLPLWQPIFQTLECEPCCIVMVRNPLEVAASLEKRNRLLTEESVWLWLAYSLEAERFSRSYRRCFISYGDLLSNPRKCTEHIASSFDVIWPTPFEQIADAISAFLEPSLRHHQFDEQALAGTKVTEIVKELYSLLSQETRGINVPHAQFDDLYRSWHRLMSRFGLAHHGQEVERRLLSDLDRLAKQNEQLSNQYQSSHKELIKVSDWASGLKQSLEQVQGENAQLKQQFEAKHQELMRISDWASGMKQDLLRVEGEKAQIKEQFEAKHQELMRISDWATDLKQLLEQLQGENAQLKQQFEARHQELMRISDWASGMKQDLLRVEGEKAQIKEQFEAQHQELMRISDWASGMKQDLLRVEGEKAQIKEQFEAQHQELMRISDWASGMRQDLLRVQDDLEAKHAELMKMSDWAYGMKLRLEAIDRSYLMFPAKRLMALEYWARGKVNQMLAHSLFERWRQRRNYRINMANYPGLKDSVAANKGRLVITFPIITWEFRWQRPQQIVSRLADRGFAVLYLAMGLFSKGKSYQSVEEAGTDLGFNELSQHIHQIWLHAKNKINVYTDTLQGEDLVNLEYGLAAAIGVVDPKKLFYLVQFPGWAPLAMALREKFGGRLVFDCMDDHSGFSTNTEQALRTEEALIKQADLVIASSSLLEEKLKMLNANTILVKNGTEFEHFQQPETNGELDHLSGKPIIGYYGAISDWFDMELVVYCARQRPDWHFVLIGSTFGCDITSAQALSNISFLGEKPYAELPGYLAYFDVCTIPFKIVPLTLATNPVKFYEYLSSGKPVVAVDLPELHPYGDDCYLARDADEFLQQLENALAQKDDPKLAARRIALAKSNSWDQRVETILQHPVFVCT